MSRIDSEFFARDTLAVARDLIGVRLAHGGAAGIIVEAEAYTDDAASHYVTRRPSAGQLMGETWGRIYIYRIYGMHLCLNFTTDRGGPGAVLIRALEPVAGLETMRERRGVERVEDLCSGPGKLVQALGIDISLNASPIARKLSLEPPRRRFPVETTHRVGIAAARELPWRFVASGSRFVSRPGRAARRAGATGDRPTSGRRTGSGR